MAKKLALEAGESRFDRYGPIRVMAVAEGWAMVRRPRAKPWVLRVADVMRLNTEPVAASDGMAPLAMDYGVL